MIWLSLVLMPLCLLWAADEPASPPPRELFAQVVNIDRPDFKAKGKIALHRLRPLAGQLMLSEAHGDPEWIYTTIAPWNGGLVAMLRQLKIETLTLADADLLLDGPKINLSLAQAVIPEGRIDQVAYQKEEAGVWQVATAALRLERLPKGLDGLVMPLLSGAVGLDRLEASGDRERGKGWASGVFGPGWRVARLEGAGEVTGRNEAGHPVRGVFTWNASGTRMPGLRGAAGQIPELAELLRFAGRDPRSADPVDLGKVAMRVESDGQGTFGIKDLRVDASWVQLYGEGVLLFRGVGQQGRLQLNVLAKTPTGKEKRFKIDLPLKALVKS
ncbi:MAG: hypothetical protein HQL91_01335 [Magnetococcales bacterium]|nr:hypothetical protein [Magnetococcales bacterium]